MAIGTSPYLLSAMPDTPSAEGAYSSSAPTTNAEARRTERLYEGSARFAVRSAGTLAVRGRELRREDVEWTDLVVTMEEHHRRSIERAFPDVASKTRILVLGIPDVYEYMSLQLQREIPERFEAAIG